MAIRVGINGFGRIGRMFYRAALHHKDALEIVAVNDITDAATLAHLLKYDSIHRTLSQDVRADGGGISVDGKPLKVLAERDPGKLPWKDLGVQVVVESTGLFTSKEAASKHIGAGAKKVVISAPADGADVTLCMGVNQETFDPGQARHHFERVVHDQLPRAGGEGAQRFLRYPARPDDDGASDTPRTRICRTGRIAICGARGRRRSR